MTEHAQFDLHSGAPGLEIVLELKAKFGKPRDAMRKLFAAMALLTLVGTVLLTGCKQEEAPPEPPPTDAPAQP